MKFLDLSGYNGFRIVFRKNCHEHLEIVHNRIILLLLNKNLLNLLLIYFYFYFLLIHFKSKQISFDVLFMILSIHYLFFLITIS